jgi:hypothetical protein
MTVCAVVSQATRVGNVVALPAVASLAGGRRELLGPWCCGWTVRPAPCPVAVVQAVAEEVGLVECGGAVLEPGIVLSRAKVAGFKAAPRRGWRFRRSPAPHWAGTLA